MEIINFNYNGRWAKAVPVRGMGGGLEGWIVSSSNNPIGVELGLMSLTTDPPWIWSLMSPLSRALTRRKGWLSLWADTDTLFYLMLTEISDNRDVRWLANDLIAKIRVEQSISRKQLSNIDLTFFAGRDHVRVMDDLKRIYEAYEVLEKNIFHLSQIGETKEKIENLLRWRLPLETQEERDAVLSHPNLFPPE